MDTNFSTWLQAELDSRGIGARDLAQMMGVAPATVYRVLNEERGVGRRLVKKIAKALKVKDTVVLFHAGIVEADPDDPSQKLDPIARDILTLLENRTPAEKRAAKSTLEALFENMDRGRDGQSHERDRQPSSRQKQG